MRARFASVFLQGYQVPDLVGEFLDGASIRLRDLPSAYLGATHPSALPELNHWAKLMESEGAAPTWAFFGGVDSVAKLRKELRDVLSPSQRAKTLIVVCRPEDLPAIPAREAAWISIEGAAVVGSPTDAEWERFREFLPEVA